MDSHGSPLQTEGPIVVGEHAPDFSLPDQFGQDVSLAGFRGRKAVVLFFYPFAFTGVCTGELGGIRDRLDEFLTFDTELLAISCDPVASLAAYSESDGLNFPLLSDFWPHGAVSSSYGVLDERRGAPRRSSFLVDKEGVVRWSVHNQPSEARDLDEHLAHLRSLA